MMDKLPDEFILPNPYNLPIHNQGQNNCTSHAFAKMIEYQLSSKFRERTLVDADDLWNKQKRFGTATEAGDTFGGVFIVAAKYGVRFKTDSGKTGTYFLESRIVWD